MTPYGAPIGAGSGRSQRTTSRRRRRPKPNTFYGAGAGIPDPGSPGQAAGPGPATTPAPAGPAGPPVDPMLEAQKASAALGITLGNAWDTYQTGRIEQDYGINDASNPYSRAKLLEESYRNSQRGNTTSYAAQGQLYSGALQNAQNAATRNYNVGYDQLARQRQDALDAITKGKLDRYSGLGANIDEATLQSLLAALGVK